MNPIRKIKSTLYSWIRPFFVKDIDINEDFTCLICGGPVLRRYLLCSSKKCLKRARDMEWL